MRTIKTNLHIVAFVKRLTIRICFLFASPGLYAQVSDNFSDGNFSSNPVWSGDVSEFSISSSSALPPEVSPSLRLQSENSDTSILVVQSYFGEAIEWRFLVKLSFNTSSGNFARVYLVSDSIDLKGPLNGIYLQIGGVEDSLKLFRQQGTEHLELLTGTTSYTGNSSNLFRLKITRDEAGNWELFSDPEGGCAFVSEGTGFDPDLPEGGNFGFFCRYTSSNATKFYFDDVYIQNLYADTSGPVIDSIQMLSDTFLKLHYSEAVDFVSAKDTVNYLLNAGIGHPSSVDWESQLMDQVILKLDSSLTANQVYQINVENIRDLSGNKCIPEQLPVIYSPPPLAGPFDLVINEIMADISPVPPGLPEAEYVELFNRTDQHIQLDGYAVKPRESGVWLSFDKMIMQPGEYLILTNTAGSELFSTAVHAIGLPGFSLNNEGVVVLRDREGKILHRVEYSKAWYEDEDKKEGGWSLEQIDPGFPCPGQENWNTSVNPSGGTPGYMNSIDAFNPVPLRITELIVISDTVLQIHYNQVVACSLATDPVHYMVDRGIGYPDFVLPADSNGKSFHLQFYPSLSKGTLYELRIASGLKNCIGEMMQAPDPVIFGIPETPEKNDLVINEVLNNPAGNGVDFVEVYNRSQKIIEPTRLQLGEIKVDQFGLNDTIYRAAELSRTLFFPGEFLLFTKDPDVVMEQYYCGEPTHFVTMDPFPSLPNDGGIVVLATLSGSVVDMIEYSEDMHHPLLVSPEGVSLERIHFDRPSLDPTNWHSSASTVGYATPALPNSQFAEYISKKDEVYVDPEIFSPDNDGRDDVTQICYRFSDPGNMAELLVYDVRGRPVRCLVNNEMLDREGCFIWDGTSESGDKVAIGIYLFYLEVFNTDGVVKKYKQSVVVAGYLH